MLDTIGVLARRVGMAFSARHNRGLSPQSGELDTIGVLARRVETITRHTLGFSRQSGDLDTIGVLARKVEMISSTQSES